MRISGTRYGYLCRVLVVLFPTLGTILPPPPPSPPSPPSSPRVWWIPACVQRLYMSYGRSHGHERWNAPASQARTRSFARIRVEEPLMSLAVFFRPPECVIGRSRRRGKKG